MSSRNYRDNIRAGPGRVKPKNYAEFPHHTKVARMNKLLCGAPQDVKSQIKWDDEALWSFTPLDIGDQLCEELLKVPGMSAGSVITDCMSSVGGNTVSFARRFGHVNAVEPDPGRKSMLDHNVGLFKLGNVTTHLGYYQDFMGALEQDAIFMDPPWGGVDYKDTPHGGLRLDIADASGAKAPIEEIIVSMAGRARVCMVKLPVNYDVKNLEARVSGVGDVVRTLEYPRPNTMMVKIIRYRRADN